MSGKGLIYSEIESECDENVDPQETRSRLGYNVVCVENDAVASQKNAWVTHDIFVLLVCIVFHHTCHLPMNEIIKLCCYVIRSTRSPEGSQRPPGWPQVSPGRLTPRGRSGGPYHVTTQFYFYPVMSKIQNSINIYPCFWRRSTRRTQDFGNSWGFERDVIMIWHCDVTAVVLVQWFDPNNS